MTANTAMTSIKERIKEELKGFKDTVQPPSGYNISLKGKVFTLPDGKSSPGPMDCIILDYRAYNSYYKGAYNAQKPEAPICFALGTNLKQMTPSENVKEQQHTDCESCAFNQYNSATNGGKGKACKNQRRIAVVPVEAKPDTQPWVITVSPTGIKSFEAYRTRLDEAGKIPIETIVKISFDPNQAFPQLVFSDEELHDKSLEMLWGLRERAATLLDKEPEYK